MAETFIHNLTSGAVTQNVNTNPSAIENRGQLSGQSVVATNIMSTITDASEELSFAASALREKTLTERKSKGGSSSDLELYRIARRYLEQVPDLGSTERLDRLSRELLRQQHLNQQQLLTYLENFSEDVSHQFIGLKYAQEALKRQGANAELLNTLNTALNQLEQTHGPKIRAGINISALAAQFAEQDLGTLEGLRETYRDAVVDFTHARATARYLIQHFGQIKFSKAIRFIEQSLAVELNSKAASLPKAQLTAIAKDLGALRKLRSALALADQLFQRLMRVNSRQEKSKNNNQQQSSAYDEYEDENA